MDEKTPDFIAILLSWMDPSTIYAMGYDVAEKFLPISAILLTLAVFIRASNEQFNAVSSQQVNWSKFLMDVFLWGTLLTFYFYLSIPVIQFFNLMYSWAEQSGSFSTITVQISSTIEKLNSLPSKEDTDLTDVLDNTVGYIAYGAAWLAYMISFIFTLFVASFLKMGHALAFSLAYIWGLVAIPLGIVNNFKLIRPWAIVSGVVLLWPFFESVLLFFFKGLFLGATTSMMASMGSYSPGAEASFFIAFSILNFIIAATLIVAPFLAQSFLTGSGLTATIATFAGAALAAAGNTIKAFTKPASVASKAMDSFRRGASNTSFERSMRDLNRFMNQMSNGPNGGGNGPQPGSVNDTLGNGNAAKSEARDSNTTAGGVSANAANASVDSNPSRSANVTPNIASTVAPNAAAEAAAKPPNKSDSTMSRFNPNKSATQETNVHKLAEEGESPTHDNDQQAQNNTSNNTVAAEVEQAAQKRRDAKKSREGYFINEAMKKQRLGDK